VGRPRRRYADRRCYWFVGGGPNTATAYEAALKMGEASHALAAGFNCEQFLHGAWAALEPADVVFLMAPPGPSHERSLAVARVVKDIGAPLVALVREDDGRSRRSRRRRSRFQKSTSCSHDPHGGPAPALRLPHGDPAGRQSGRDAYGSAAYSRARANVHHQRGQHQLKARQEKTTRPKPRS